MRSAEYQATILLKFLIITHHYANVQTINQSKSLPGFWVVVTSLDGINGWSIQTLVRGENDSKQLDEIQAIPGWDWKNHLVKKCNYPSLHYQVGDILDDKSLVQSVEEPTRQQNTLDLAITNQPIIIRNVCIVPGVSDTSKDPTL